VRALFGAVAGDAVEEVLVDEQAAGGGADLSLVEEDALRGARDRGRHVGVVENDVRAPAAELERDVLEVRPSCDLGDLLADLAARAHLSRLEWVLPG